MCHCPQQNSGSKIQPRVALQPLLVSPQEPAPLRMYSYSQTTSWRCFDTPLYKVQGEHTKASIYLGYSVFCSVEQLPASHIRTFDLHVAFQILCYHNILQRNIRKRNGRRNTTLDTTEETFGRHCSFVQKDTS